MGATGTVVEQHKKTPTALGVIPGLRCLFCTETFCNMGLNYLKNASIELACSLLSTILITIDVISDDLESFD